MKLRPPAKSVNLSSWKMAAIRKNISWITKIVMPEMAKWSESRMFTAIFSSNSLARLPFIPKAYLKYFCSCYEITNFSHTTLISPFTVYFHAILHEPLHPTWQFRSRRNQQCREIFQTNFFHMYRDYASKCFTFSAHDFQITFISTANFTPDFTPTRFNRLSMSSATVLL